MAQARFTERKETEEPGLAEITWSLILFFELETIMTHVVSPCSCPVRANIVFV